MFVVVEEQLQKDEWRKCYWYILKYIYLTIEMHKTPKLNKTKLSLGMLVGSIVPYV